MLDLPRNDAGQLPVPDAECNLRRLVLTILLTVAFAVQATGVSSALHLALEHGDCHDQSSLGVESIAGDGHSAVVVSDRLHSKAHDHAHCAVCQALAAFSALCAPPTLVLSSLKPLRALLPTADQPRLLSTCFGTLGARAPPTSDLCPTD